MRVGYLGCHAGVLGNGQQVVRCGEEAKSLGRWPVIPSVDHRLGCHDRFPGAVQRDGPEL
jgi:hypothetical protein